MGAITPAIAREYQKRGLEARKRNAEERARIAALPPQPPVIPPPDTYCAKRLKRVRAQLDRFDDMLMKDDDPQRIDRLASATAKLSEQERQLSDRPLPGTKKPTDKPARPQRRVFDEPMPDENGPLVVETPQPVGV